MQLSCRRRIGLFGISVILVSTLPSSVNGLLVHNRNSTPSPGKDNHALDLLRTARLLHQQRNRSLKDGQVLNIQMEDHAPTRKVLNRHVQSIRRNSSWEILFDDDTSVNEVSLEQQDAFMSSKVEAHLPSIEKLRGSLGSEIPEMELYLQMEAARARALATSSNTQNPAAAATLAFMDLHHEKRGMSTSTIEKVAMSSLPSQLPGLATASLSNTVSSRRRQSKTHRTAATMRTKIKTPTAASLEKTGYIKRKSDDATDGVSETQEITGNQPGGNSSDTQHHDRLSVKRIKSKDISTIMATRRALEINAEESEDLRNPVPPSRNKRLQLDDNTSSTARVSHEQEIQLARIVQRGVELHSLKSAFEEEHGRDITRQEWTELAKLDSPRELRRIVSNYRKAKNKLVMANMGLVHAVVRSRLGKSGSNRQMTTTAGGTSYEELVQEGSLGLLRAAELFDPSRGLRFSTYATIWIKGILGNNNLTETIKLPLREKTKFNKIQMAISDIVSERGGDENNLDRPTAVEIANRCEFSEEEVEQVMTKMKRARNILSLDYQYNSYSRSGVQDQKYDALSNDKNLMDDVNLVERLHVRADVIAALARNLDPREARLMRLRYGLNDGRTRSISDCAEAMGISRAKATELAVGCLKKLREADDAESLQEYLLSVA